MGTRLELGDLLVEVTSKDIRNVHLSVHPPAGRVTISAPRRTKLDTLRVFAISKLGWIEREQEKIRSQEREPGREYLDRETHYVWGRRCLLSVAERAEPPSVALRHSTLLLFVRPGTETAGRHGLVDAWYRAQVRQALPALTGKWRPILGVEPVGYYVRRMRTRWGSCNPAARTVRLNTDLAKKPRECLEYVLVHELVHLIEPTHNARFVALMDGFMPRWRDRRSALDRLPVRHDGWGTEDRVRRGSRGGLWLVAGVRPLLGVPRPPRDAPGRRTEDYRRRVARAATAYWPEAAGGAVWS